MVRQRFTYSTHTHFVMYVFHVLANCGQTASLAGNREGWSWDIWIRAKFWVLSIRSLSKNRIWRFKRAQTQQFLRLDDKITFRFSFIYLLNTKEAIALKTIQKRLARRFARMYNEDIFTFLRRSISNSPALRSFSNCSTGGDPDVILSSLNQAFQFQRLALLVGFCCALNVHSNRLGAIVADKKRFYVTLG